MILPASAPESITACADTLRAGGLIGLPTETVYGLAADAGNDAAVAQIFAAKGRPADHPLIVHVSAQDGGMSGVAHFASQVPPFAQQLMSAFWPGPLTLILPRRAGVG
ncbi:MAG: Sua5/YciO/YrdC/YwlC family protein, partial [Rhodoferax sp.]